jgi:hypothetical protein
MATPIIPRLVRGRLYFEIGPVLFPTIAQAATAPALDGPIPCEGGSFATMICFKPEELRRLWTGNTAPVKVGVL